MGSAGEWRITGAGECRSVRTGWGLDSISILTIEDVRNKNDRHI
jgi:hypothetical protein